LRYFTSRIPRPASDAHEFVVFGTDLPTTPQDNQMRGTLDPALRMLATEKIVISTAIAAKTLTAV